MNDEAQAKPGPPAFTTKPDGRDPLQLHRLRPTTASDAHGYRTVATACVPRWMDAIGTAPWLRLACARHHTDSVNPGTLLRQVSSAMALGLYADGVAPTLDRNDVHEYVRAAVVFWQTQLTSHGNPRCRKLCRNPLYVYIASRIAQWLAETGGLDTPMLLEDLDRHVQWLERIVYRAGWLEAAMIATLADSAVALRRTALLRDAHHRLDALLQRQTAEGWFPEHGGVDVGLLSLTIDSLARLYHRHNWEELTKPLNRALRFLQHFVTPTGSTGACCSTLGTGFISPYGVELLAPTHENAAAIAILLRRRYADVTSAATRAWSDDLAALLGPAIVLASRSASERLSTDNAEPIPSRFITHFEQAKLIVVHTRDYRAVVSTRHGGACWIWWAQSGIVTEDPGICAVFPHHVRISGLADNRNKHEVHGTHVTCGGVLRRLVSRQGGTRRSLGRWLRRLTRPRRGNAEARPSLTKASPLPPEQRLALAHDYFRREVDFGEDRIELTDELICRVACQHVVCQSGIAVDTHPLIDRTPAELPVRPPLYLRGGRHVAVTRMYRDGRLERSHDRPVD